MISGMYVQGAIFILIGALIIGYAWVFIGSKLKKQALAAAGGISTASMPGRVLTATPTLIETAGARQEETLELSFEQLWEETQLELVEDEESLLLKTAEKLVDEVQEIVTFHIASFPPNPDEVYTKIKAHLSGYSILCNTEYEDAINRFIAVTVKRDCELELTEKELSLLWQ